MGKFLAPKGHLKKNQPRGRRLSKNIKSRVELGRIWDELNVIREVR